MSDEHVFSVVAEFAGVLVFDGTDIEVFDEEALRGGEIDRLVYWAVFGETDDLRQAARWMVGRAAARLGVHPASIHEYYMARGRGTCTGATTPAINVRAMSYDTCRAVWRAARTHDVGALIFEIARSEIGYTAQRPSEYAAVVLGAAIREGHVGPVFIQGDHFQVNPSKYAAEPEAEVGAIRDLISEAVAAGFYNIDIDTSTLVDIGLDSVRAQQAKNAEVSALLTAHVRSVEPPGVTISLGGEIGEVGKTNSTPEELRAYMDQYGSAKGDVAGLSKISIQTGTSHGGVVLPDGSLAQVAIDFDCLAELGRISREEYGLGGAVQHGASTLPGECFDEFSKADAVEVHLATNFQNMVYDAPEFPEALRSEVYAYLDANLAGERKADDTVEQFHYKLRKKGIGPFKKQFWEMPAEARGAIAARLEETFGMLFTKLGVNGTREAVRAATTIVPQSPEFAVVGPAAPDDTSLDD